MTAITTAEHTPANQTAGSQVNGSQAAGSQTAPKFIKTGSGKKYVLTTDANGISNYDKVGDCIPNLVDIEKFLVPILRDLGVEKAMLTGEFLRAYKWGDARLSDELLLVVLSDRKFADFADISYATLREFGIFIPVRLYECDFMAPDGNWDDFAFSRFSDWKVLQI